MDTTYDFIERLSTKEPVPGGGGAGALMGATAAALCSMARKSMLNISLTLSALSGI